MSASYVRSRYGVPAKRFMRVTVNGHLGTIMSFPGEYIGVRFDGDRYITRCDPKWRVEYDVDSLPPPRRCAVDGCERPYNGHGYCKPHRKRERLYGDPLAGAQRTPPEPRFWAKVNKAGPMPAQGVAPGCCWIWRGSKTPGGYGQFRPDYLGAMVVSHRYSYELLVGPIPEGLQLDHLCRNRACVNPQHLEPVTQVENIRRGFSIATFNRLKTECPQGHPYDTKNTYINPRTKGRFCRACARERSRLAYQKRKQAA